jgi:hypothetical protein
MIDHGAGIGRETRHGTADVRVDFDDFFNGRGFEEDGRDALFDAQDDAFGGTDADCGGAELVVSGNGNGNGGLGIQERYFDCFDGVFDLE